MAWDFRCPNFGNPNVFFAIYYYQHFGCPNFGNPNVFSQLSIAKILGVRISETQCVFAIFYYPYFGCLNFGNPNFRPNPLVMLCCYYHFPHKMRQTIEIRISSTVSRNFGRIVRKLKKLSQ